jgi:hypothetical protein
VERYRVQDSIAMFTIDAQTGFVLYLFLALAGLCVVAGYEAWRTDLRHWTLTRGKLWRCTDCSFTFVVRRAETVARCPRCHRACTTRGR